MTLVTVDRDYEFEVAFSFLQEDEELAYAINDLIQDRLTTFFYSQHQKELVGKDGTDTFREVFSEKARIVVVLYRESWGTTFWTRVEENAIKHRALDESADFTIFISLDTKKPKWLSVTQIWYDFERFGIKPTAAIIEKRIAEYGGKIREESVIDQASRHKRQLQRQRELQEYLSSGQGYLDGIKEAENVLNIAEKNIKEITDESIGLTYGVNKKPNSDYTSFGKKCGLTFKWYLKYNNSLAESSLIVYIADHKHYDRFPGDPGTVFREKAYVFYENEAKTKGWVEKETKSGFITTIQLVNKWQKEFLNRDQQDRKKHNDDHSMY